jgi:enolase
MTEFFTSIQTNKDALDILIKAIALLGAIISVAIALYSANYGKRKAKYEFFRDFYDDFLSPEVLKKRNSVASFWMQQLKTDEQAFNGHIEIPELAEINDNEAISAYLKKRLGVEITTITDDFLKDNKDKIAETEEVLNKYEHLAKLYELDVITTKDIQTFFYTMLADTFVVCSPFILFRRVSKPSYAHKMQKLIGILPMVSKNWTRV